MKWRVIITIALSLALHGVAMLWLKAQELGGREAVRERAPLKFRVVEKPMRRPAVVEEPKPAVSAGPAGRKLNASKSRKRVAKGKTPRVQKPKRRGQKRRGRQADAGKKGANGYTALLPDAGSQAERTAQAFREGQRDDAEERRLSANGGQMNDAMARLAELMASHISLAAILKDHLGFSRASVRLVNHPSRGLYLKDLEGQAILRAKLFGFLQSLPGLQSWRDIRAQPFAIVLELRTERGAQAKERTTMTRGTISRVIVSKQTSAAEKYLFATDAPTGEVRGGVNILALLEPLLAGDDHEELRRELKALRNSPAFREELKFYRLKAAPDAKR